MKPSTVRLRYDPGLRRFSGTTENVARMSLDVAHLRPGDPVRVALDGQAPFEIPWPAGESRVWLAREGERWVGAPKPSPAMKGPHRSGLFKDAFRHRVAFVYGTAGHPEEAAHALAKARFDAETFRYRGNASVDVLPDTAFDPAADRDRSVILYGNADMNAAWKALLSESPVQVTRESVRVGDRTVPGDDLACLFIRPRPGSDVASVGVVGGTGLKGLRLTDRLPYFLSGVAFPDVTVLGPESLTKPGEGVRAAGFFGNDWGVPTGEIRGDKGG